MGVSSRPAANMLLRLTLFCSLLYSSQAIFKYPWHASCKINWEIPEPCQTFKSKIISQMNAWQVLYLFSLIIFYDHRGIHSVLEQVTPVLICLAAKDAFTSSKKVPRITSTELIKHLLQDTPTT